MKISTDEVKLIKKIYETSQENPNFVYRIIVAAICGCFMSILHRNVDFSDTINSQDLIYQLLKNTHTLCEIALRPEKLTQMPYKEYLQTKEWQIKRKSRLIVDNYKCVICGSSENLQVHHLTYENRGNEPLEDLQTLCEDHHKETHNIQ